MNLDIGIISGSGLYDFPLKDKKEKKIHTPFGSVRLKHGKFSDKTIGFLPRHGKSHSVPPKEVPYRANIFALFKLGVECIITTSAVGSLQSEITVGSFVILDQIMDFTKHRTETFFDGDFQVRVNGKIKEGVVHTDMTHPYCEKLRRNLIEAGKNVSENICEKGTYICTEGPRFETGAEIDFYSQFGDVIGMTQAPEVFLANELEICYATVSTVTNYAAGLQEKVTHKEVTELMKKQRTPLIKLIKKTIKNIGAHC